MLSRYIADIGVWVLAATAKKTTDLFELDYVSWILSLAVSQRCSRSRSISQRVTSYDVTTETCTVKFDGGRDQMQVSYL